MGKAKKSAKNEANQTEYRGRRLAFDILNRVLLGGGYSNTLLAAKLDREALTPEDKHAATNLVYGVLRNLALIDEIFRSKTDKGKLELSPRLLNVGRMAIFEILFSKNIPAYATVSEYVKMARKEGSAGEAGFLNACLRKTTSEDRERITKAAADPIARMAIRYSHPLWMAHTVSEAYGSDEARHVFRANNNPQPMYFRVNTFKIGVGDLVSALEYKYHGFQALGSPPFCFSFPLGKGIFPKIEYDSGWLTPQDRSTQFVPFYVQPEAGDRILDLCCGSGIKSAQMAELMGNEGEVVSVDKFRHKIDSLGAECKRLGLTCIKGVEADITARPELGEFEKVLLDVPCSGSGTLRHRPEIKFRIKESDIESLTKTQDALLDSAAGYTAPGGTLVYATCSILPVENERRVELFLERHADFICITKEVESLLPFSVVHFMRGRWGTTFLPVTVNGCGVFVSVLRRRPRK